jgi:hypothetical protein
MKKKLKEMEGEAEKLRKIQEDAEENNESAPDRWGFAKGVRRQG